MSASSGQRTVENGPYPGRHESLPPNALRGGVHPLANCVNWRSFPFRSLSSATQNISGSASSRSAISPRMNLRHGQAIFFTVSTVTCHHRGRSRSSLPGDQHRPQIRNKTSRGCSSNCCQRKTNTGHEECTPLKQNKLQKM